MPTFVLLVGVMYGSLGATITELAVIVGGGKLYVFHTFGLARAAASEALSVVIGAGIYPHIVPGFVYPAISPLILPIMLLPIR